MQKIFFLLFVSNIISAQSTLDYIEFNSLVDSISIYAEPDINSEVLLKRNKGLVFLFEGESTKSSIFATQKGVRNIKKWIKIKDTYGVNGWVLKSQVEPLAYDFSRMQIFKNLDNLKCKFIYTDDWVKIKTASKAEFYGLKESEKAILVRSDNIFETDSLIQLPLDNGQQKKYFNDVGEARYLFEGEIKKLGYYVIGWDYGDGKDIFFINKKNGIESIARFYKPQKIVDDSTGKFYDYINFSPDNRFAVLTTEYNPIEYKGISFLPFQKNSTNACSFYIGIPATEFRWNNKNSGIARFDNDMYLKFTLKHLDGK